MRKIALVMFLALAACGDGETEVSAEVAEARHLASRGSCIAGELAQAAEEQHQLISATGVGGAASFSEAYLQHAQLRHAAYAQVDSARNFSPTQQDSTRHAELARRFEIRAPQAGTVEANVITDYDRKFADIFNDADHPCNWKVELERGEARER